jgi:ABC-type sugar transport system permease subunit
VFAHLSWHRRRQLEGALYLTPLVLLLALFFYGPVVFAAYISLTDWAGGLIAPRWVGLANYQQLLRDPIFHRALQNTAAFTALTVLPSLALGLLIALALSRGPRLAVGGLRLAYFAPYVTAPAIVAFVWLYLFDAGSGLFNAALRAVGLPPQLWLLNPALALPSLALMANWHRLGFVVAIFVAGLQNVPEEYYEAAKIDGAGAWARFRHITWPLLTPVTLFLLITGVISTFQVFDQVRVMTQGAPLNSTNVIVYYIWQTAFELVRMSYGSALALVLFLVILGLTLAQFKALGGRVHYQ